MRDALKTCFFICGFILQSAQLKMHSKKLGTSDYIINDLMHELLKMKKFSYLSEIYEMSKEVKIDELNKKMIVINYCLGQKLQGKSVRAINKILSEYDWSAVDSMFKMSLHALRDEHDLFYNELQNEIKNGNIGISEVTSWAIFEQYNRKKKYREIIKKVI